MRVLFAGLCLCWTAAALAEEPYPDNRRLQARIAALVKSSKGLARKVSLGQSRGGRQLTMLVLAGPGKAHARPGMLIVAGLDGSHLLGTELALAAARRLITQQARLLSRRTVYVVARANPDGAARFLRSPRAGYSGNDRRIDRDRDGRKAEDGPADLDGDGRVLQLRVRHPEGRWMPDPVEPRLLRLADPVQGQRGVYKLYREGALDADGDGERNEDRADGVDPNRNFAHRYDMHQDDAGRFPSSEPSSKALMDLLIRRPNIGLVLVYGLDDNLVRPPAAGRVQGRRPMVKLDPDDLPYYKQIGQTYQRMTGVKGKPRPVPGGTFFEWCYFHRGLPTFAVRGWHAPPPAPKKGPGKSRDASKGPGGKQAPKQGGSKKAPKQAASKKAPKQAASKKAPKQAGSKKAPKQDASKKNDAKKRKAAKNKPGARKGPKNRKAAKNKKAPKQDAKKDQPHPDLPWIQYADRIKAGFKRWTKYQHPTLGAVEIGGFVPGFRINPPAADLPGLCAAEAPFAAHLLGLLPAIRLVDVKQTKLAGGLFRISAAVTNDGRLPAILAQGRRNRAVRPVVVELLGDYTLVGARPSGQAMSLIELLAPMGGRVELSWLVRASGKLTVRMRTGRGYEARKGVTLR